MNDPAPRDPLSSTLQSWHHEPAPAPDFNTGVWSRIRSAETTAAAPVSALARILHFPSSSAFPVAASLAIIVSLAAGTGGAFALNRTVTTERMAAAYVRTIDPIQMTAANGAHVSHAHP